MNPGPTLVDHFSRPQQNHPFENVDTFDVEQLPFVDHGTRKRQSLPTKRKYAPEHGKRLLRDSVYNQLLSDEMEKSHGKVPKEFL